MKKSEIYKLFPHHTKSMLNEALILYNSKRNYQLENKYTFNYVMFDTILFGLDNGAYAVTTVSSLYFSDSKAETTSNCTRPKKERMISWVMESTSQRKSGSV